MVLGTFRVDVLFLSILGERNCLRTLADLVEKEIKEKIE